MLLSRINELISIEDHGHSIGPCCRVLYGGVSAMWDTLATQGLSTKSTFELERLNYRKLATQHFQIETEHVVNISAIR